MATTHPADTAEHWGPWWLDREDGGALVHLSTDTRVPLSALVTGRDRIQALGDLATERWWNCWAERQWETACAALLRSGWLLP